MEMKGVGFLGGHMRMYITPVTVLDGQARVGTTRSTLRLPSLAHMVVVERTHRQVLTFEWPQGADEIWVWVGVPGQPVNTVTGPAQETITHDQYKRQGGMYFRWPLPARGCSVHAAAVAFGGGRAVMGPKASQSYPGLTVLDYTVGVARDKAQQPRHVTLQIFAAADDSTPPHFVLVHNSDRLPLHSDDGTGIALNPVGDPGAVGGLHFRPPMLRRDPGEARWTGDVTGRTGYLRLFVIGLSPDRQATTALLDPPMMQLELTPQPGPDQ